MTIYKGSQKQKDIYIGNDKISKIYKGSTLIYISSVYPIDTVLFESSTAGTSEVELETGIYEVYCIGGGGGGATSQKKLIVTRYEKAGGGSGSGFIGNIRIEKGNYTIIVGGGGNAAPIKDTWTYGGAGGNSSISNVLTCFGGGGGAADANGSEYRDGQGGNTPSVVSQVITQTLNQAGNKSNGGTGGLSLYNQYGAGGSATNSGGQKGSSGYVKIVYKGN